MISGVNDEMIYQVLPVVFCFAETIVALETSRYYDKQKESRALANRTNRFELGQSRSSIKSMECLTKCNQSPACRAVNAFRNGTCEILLSPVISVDCFVESTAYIGFYKTCPTGFGYILGTTATGTCYKFALEKNRTWDSAREYCYSVGGDLLSVETAKEMVHLKDITSSDPHLLWPQAYYWTSGRKVEESGEFVWSSSGGQINGSLADNNFLGVGSGGCLRISFDKTSSTWGVGNCTLYRFPVCEVSLG